MKPQGLTSGEGVNNTKGRHVSTYSTFDDSLSYLLANTHRFGECTPTFYMQGVPKDSIRLNAKDHYDGMTLKAPFKGAIRRTKDSFMVPKMALLPFNWDLIYVQPSNGDDVPTAANTILPDFEYVVGRFYYNMLQALATGGSPVSTHDAFCKYLTAVLRILVTGESIYSTGSLMSTLGYKVHQNFVHGDDGNFDDMFDKVISTLIRDFESLQAKDPFTGKTSYYSTTSRPKAVSNALTADAPFRLLLERFRENPAMQITALIQKEQPTSWSSTIAADTYSDVSTAMSASTNRVYPSVAETGLTDDNFGVPVPGTGSNDDITADDPRSFNYDVLAAYQMICHHYYTNSSVDFMYTAELYRQYHSSLFEKIIGPFSGTTDATYRHLSNFERNGMTLKYDFLSGRRIAASTFYRADSGVLNTNAYLFSYSELSGTIDSESTSAQPIYRLLAIASLFGYRKSLRYVDYFVGSRPRPLAPVNTDVAVNPDTNKVSVIDITRNIQAQRFANAVMRSRQKIEDYVKDLFGKAPAPDFHNPFFLASQQDVIFGEEVQNTGEAQVTEANSRTSVMNTNLDAYTFTFTNDDNHPCIYMQIVTYDIRRAYTRTKERTYFHRTRYDMFNPDFQYIGDQPVYQNELGYRLPNMLNNRGGIFGYQARDMEYKQRFDQAAGAFIYDLPGWIITDTPQYIATASNGNVNIDSDFIRSWSYEIDDLFLSLTGYSLGKYFHFAVVTMNNVSAKRAMAVDPQILA